MAATGLPIFDETLQLALRPNARQAGAIAQLTRVPTVMPMNT